jgi:hypothetical protein
VQAFLSLGRLPLSVFGLFAAMIAAVLVARSVGDAF